MSTFEDYDEFGNYIGADLEWDDEDENPQNNGAPPPPEQPQAAPLDGYEDDPMQGNDQNALMEVDGTF